MKKRILNSVLSIIVMLAMMIPFMPVIASAEGKGEGAEPTIEYVEWDQWDDNNNGVHEDGENTAPADVKAAKAWLTAHCKDENGVYVLDSALDLAYFMACGRGQGAASFTGETVRLGADIVWNDATVENGVFKPAEGVKIVYLWEPYSLTPKTSSNYFKGTFDGNGKTVSGLYFSQSCGTAGFFGAASEGAEIQNVTFSNACVENTAATSQYIKSDHTVKGANVGIVVGAYGGATDGVKLSNVMLENCYVKSSCVDDTIGGVGAFCGAPFYQDAILTLENCVADHNTTVVGITNAGGFVGSDLVKNGGTQIKVDGCISYANIVCETTATSAFVGKSECTVNIANSAFLGMISADKYSAAGKVYQNGADVINIEMDDADNGVVAIEGIQSRPNEDDQTKFDVRFVASVDFDEVYPALTKDDFEKFGFEVAEIGKFATKAENAVENVIVKTVYTSIESVYGSIEIVGLHNGWNRVAYAIDADYLSTLKIEDISTSGIQTVVVRPYYVPTNADEPTYGSYVVVTLLNGKIAAHTNVSSVKDNKIAVACALDTESYDITALFSGEDLTVWKNGEKQSGTQVALAVGINDFEVSAVKDGIETLYNVSIARRDKYRVVFNTNGGSFIDNQYVEEGTGIDLTTVVPTRERYEFVGWYDQEGNTVTGNVSITKDTTFIAHWDGPKSVALPDDTPIKYFTSSAALNINWQDYDNAFGVRPTEVRCTLTNLANNTRYRVKVTKDSAEFIGARPDGALISRGAGNWTVKITDLPFAATYTFVMNDLDNESYTTKQSGTTVYNTVKGYEPMRDDTAALRTENGRFYDVAGNVVILKGFTTVNVNDSNFNQNTTKATLERLKAEGINCLRITMPLGDTDGYRTEGKKEIFVPRMQGAIDRASALGMYVIVDWGVMMKQGDGYIGRDKTDAEGNVIKPNYNYFEDWLPAATEFFGNMSLENKGNPYVVYELANEPAVANSTTAWETYLKPWYEELINTIRGNDVNAVILAAPNMSARRISDVDKADGSDPIDKPFDTAISYNIGYTFHCYAYTTTYDVKYALFKNEAGEQLRQASRYGHIMSDAVKNGLTMVITEFCPTDASLTSKYGVDDQGLNADFAEFEKWLKFVLENDVNYTMLRYDTPTTARMTDGQFPLIQGFVFVPECDAAVYSGTWTYDMLSYTGQYVYNNIFNATGFIKGALFAPNKTAETE